MLAPGTATTRFCCFRGYTMGHLICRLYLKGRCARHLEVHDRQLAFLHAAVNSYYGISTSSRSSHKTGQGFLLPHETLHSSSVATRTNSMSSPNANQCDL